MKRTKVVQYVVDMEAGTIGFVVAGAGTTVLELEKTTEDTRQAALYNGFKQAGGDKAAIPVDPKTGRSATPQEKFARIKQWVEHLNAGGAWVLRTAAAYALDRASLFAAVGTVRNVDAAKVAMLWQAKSDEELRAALTNKDVAAEYARLTATGSEDGSLFEGLED